MAVHARYNSWYISLPSSAKYKHTRRPRIRRRIGVRCKAP